MSSQPPTSEQSSQQASTTSSEPSFGFSPYAEVVNGRFAMIGFVALVLIELLTGQGLLSWMGLL